MSPEANSAPASEERSLKRKASSSLSTLLARLSSFGSFGSRTSQGDEPPTPGAFALRLRKVMCVIGLTSEDSVAQPQQQEPSPDLAGFDELSPADLDDLIGKAFPLEPPVLQQKSSLDLSRLVDLTQLDKGTQQLLYLAATNHSTIALASAYLSNAAHHLVMSSRLFGLEADPSIFWRKTFASLRLHFMIKRIRHMRTREKQSTTAQHCSFPHLHRLSHRSS